MWAATSPTEPEFFCGNPEDLSATSQRLIFTNFGHKTYFSVPSRNPESHFKTFHFRGHLHPKSEIENRSNRHLTQSRLQVKGCTAERYCLLRVVVQRPGTFLGQLFSMTYGCGVTGRQSCPIFGFWFIFPIQITKPLKHTFW